MKLFYYSKKAFADKHTHLDNEGQKKKKGHRCLVYPQLITRIAITYSGWFLFCSVFAAVSISGWSALRITPYLFYS